MNALDSTPKNPEEGQNAVPGEPLTTIPVTTDQGASPVDDKAASSPANDVDAKPADSSPANKEDAKPENGALDAVLKALEIDTSKEGPVESPGGQEKSSISENDKKAEVNVGEAADDSTLPFHTHPRWQAVKAERQQAIKERDVFAESHKELESIKAYAERSNLTSNDVNRGFQLMALLKSDPKAAYGMLKPLVDKIEEGMGTRIPEDLQQRVNEGFLDEHGAREIAMLRASDAASQVTAQRAVNDVAAVRDTQASERNSDEVVAIATAWENRIKSTDPDYQLKQTSMLRDVKLAILEMQNQGIPLTQDVVVKTLDACLARINAEHANYVPRKVAITPVVGHSASASPAIVPKSSRDATFLALGLPLT